MQRGAGPWQVHACFAGPITDPPPCPQAAMCTTVSSTTATVAWQAPATLACILSYELQVSPRNSFARAAMEEYILQSEGRDALKAATHTSPGGVRTIADQLWVTAYQDSSCACSLVGLFPACAYCVRVRACSDVGPGPWSDPLQVRSRWIVLILDCNSFLPRGHSLTVSQSLVWQGVLDKHVVYRPDASCMHLTKVANAV
jgi:Fibronectin type III domain